MSAVVSARRRGKSWTLCDAGTVPHNGLDLLAVGSGPVRVSARLRTRRASSSGGAVFKAVRGEYGSGKTFFSRWLGERAKRLGMAVAEVQISETETPLHKLETVYRRVCESLETAEFPPVGVPTGPRRMALRDWSPKATPSMTSSRSALLTSRARRLLSRRRCAAIARPSSPGTRPPPRGLVAWLGGQPHVAASIRRSAGVRGDLDHFGAFGFLQGLLTVLRDSGTRASC